ncbi:uncharacterized protein BDR25DRAFT_253638 [Lindgomyces ingoldianus]|uniref:Uncharacterized protein n=1 Tax=Lindgomyces ingoldianus TaxID=673940 RepID=A0ACB6RA32_9PLEO|nr:uncharacterized protein BDR25DRAFT_253638 [Lindgomyces ingoldianus]KAF2476006.1 hypothetical protein BDR25DRAFT_253638 [Lindgomyces ingoldianus]
MSFSIPTSPLPPPEEQELRRSMSRLQASAADGKSVAGSGTAQMIPPSTAAASTAESTKPSPTLTGHQRFVLTDHVAFRYLEEDPSTTVLARRQKLEGYEIYLVEQWACSRAHPTFIITTYTGDPKDSVFANVLSVPTDESAWSPQLRIYFKALNNFHARRRETNLGTLMITNLSAFPSSLTVIPVPEGDVKRYRELFFVNENLKRLGCSGRLGIKLAQPSNATQAKFHQLYRTSDIIPLNSSVIELVKLCQVALVLFGKLEPEYADGLLCDVTEKAINDWWLEFGAEYYTVEPHDGILGPTTVAALLGMLMGARNRLSAYGAPVAKDVFDIENTKRGIAYFQKTQRIQKTRRLDRQTLEALRRATAKAASGEGWAMPRALKSTVAELGGKGGEMMMGMVGARDKAGIADVETVDIDRFIELVQGERSKWLWYGKPRKTATGDMFSRLPGEGSLTPSAEEHSHTGSLLKRESTHDGHGLTKRDTASEGRTSDVFGTSEAVEKDPNSKRAAIKRATGKIESGSGFGRIKDVVGRRGHQPKLSKHENGRISFQRAKSDNEFSGSLANDPLATQKQNHGDHLSENISVMSPRKSTRDEYEATFTKTLTQTPRASASTLVINKLQPQNKGKVDLGAFSRPTEPSEDELSKPPTVENSIAGSIYRGEGLETILPADSAQDITPLLRRTTSAEQLSPYHAENRNENWWPRHLSFSIAEESILTWPPASLAPPEPEPFDAQAALTRQAFLSSDARRLGENLATLKTIDASWVSARLTAVQDLDENADQDITGLEDMYYPWLEEYQSLREDAHEIISRERVQLQDAVRDLETMGAKLEYEINTLRSKVDDIEDGIAEFERQVEFVEEKVRELEDVVGQREGWIHWGFRMLTGIGRPPGWVD